MTRSTKPYDPSTEGAKTDFSTEMSYGDYLSLDAILNAQHPKSAAEDELLFIIQHQTSELWMKLAIHEISTARSAIANDNLRPAFKTLTRVSRIFEQLNSAWDVLRTMTPSDYTRFRDTLGPSSGFQSHQYRLIEFMLGNRNQAMLRPHAHRQEIVAMLTTELAAPSLYDEALHLLARKGIDLPSQVLNRNVGEPYTSNDGVIAAWHKVYSDPSRYWSLYELAEKLMDFEDYFRRWRFNHVTTVERIIGFKRGTGGTAGVNYLKKMLEVELFPELWRVRTTL
ncbi:MAG: tryptophan 2,3-dioxygenase [Gammaproteobacteria bacterium]|nr:tryptophan 2,3-dioxygenase [Gammaproteobacteria bacterium]